MVIKRIEFIYRPKAVKSIAIIGIWIRSKGYPDTAIRFIDELYDFGDNLGFLPYKFPICRNKRFRQRAYHCITYKRYVFVHKESDGKMVIMNVIHGSRIK